MDSPKTKPRSGIQVPSTVSKVPGRQWRPPSAGRTGRRDARLGQSPKVFTRRSRQREAREMFLPDKAHKQPPERSPKHKKRTPGFSHSDVLFSLAGKGPAFLPAYAVFKAAGALPPLRTFTPLRGFYLISLLSTSARIFWAKASSSMEPRSPSARWRTEMAPLSASLSPTTSM